MWYSISPDLNWAQYFQQSYDERERRKDGDVKLSQRRRNEIEK